VSLSEELLTVDMVRRTEVFDFENNLGTEVLREVKRARMTAMMAISEASEVFESENRVGFVIEWLSVIEMREGRPGMGLSSTLYTQEKGKQEPAGCGWFSIRRTKVFVRCLSGCRGISSMSAMTKRQEGHQPYEITNTNIINSGIRPHHQSIQKQCLRGRGPIAKAQSQPLILISSSLLGMMIAYRKTTMTSDIP